MFDTSTGYFGVPSQQSSIGENGNESWEGTVDADVLIQAGHEGQLRNHGGGTKPSHGATGLKLPEHQMTPIVADAATAVLREHGVTVERVGGVFPKTFEVQLGVCLHFDGSATPCASGSSVGYPPGVPLGSNQPTAELWKTLWQQHWPFKFMKDNFTANLSGYYGYSRMRTSIAEMLIEFGEISCREQDEWLQPRLEWIGALVAHFAGRVIGKDVPDPGSFEVAPLPPPTEQFDPWDADIAVIRLEVAELREAVLDLQRSRAEERGDPPPLDAIDADV